MSSSGRPPLPAPLTRHGNNKNDSNSSCDNCAKLTEYIDLLRGVLAVVSSDLNLKNEQFQSLFTNLRLSQTWNNCTREHDERVSKCTRPQQRDVCGVPSSSNVPPPLPPRSPAPTGCSPIQELPAEVMCAIVAMFLDYEDVVHMRAVCKQWNLLFSDQHMWKSIYKRRWKVREVTWRIRGDSWLQEFGERIEMERTWKHGKPNVMTLAAHTGTVTCLQYNDNRMISGSDDGSMVLWEINSARNQHPSHFPLVQQHHKFTKHTHKLQSFRGHGGPIWALAYDEDNLVSASYDKTVKIWCVKSGRNMHSLRGHTEWVSGVQKYHNIIVSASWDSTMRIWRSSDDNAIIDQHSIITCVRTLAGAPGNAIHCVQYDPITRTVFAGCRDHSVQLWDVEAGRVVETFMGHSKQVYCLNANNNKLVSGARDNTVRFWDRRSGRCEQVMNDHLGPVMAVSMDDDYKIVSGSFDKTVRVFDTRMVGQQLRVLYGHSSAVFTLQFDSTKIITGAADKTIRIWDFAT